jgi:putative transposase
VARYWHARTRRQRHLRDLRWHGLAVAPDPKRTRSRVQVAAELLQLSAAQVYRLLDRYLTDPRLTALLPAPRARRQGQRRLRPEVENVIQVTIDEFYLTRQKPRVAALVAEVRRRCRSLGFRSASHKAKP